MLENDIGFRFITYVAAGLGYHRWYPTFCEVVGITMDEFHGMRKGYLHLGFIEVTQKKIELQEFYLNIDVLTSRGEKLFEDWTNERVPNSVERDQPR